MSLTVVHRLLRPLYLMVRSTKDQMATSLIYPHSGQLLSILLGRLMVWREYLRAGTGGFQLPQSLQEYLFRQQHPDGKRLNDSDTGIWFCKGKRRNI